MNDAILFAVDEGLARLTLNRPARLNAFNADLAHAWRDATAEATSRSDVTAIPCLLYTSPSPRDLSTSRMPSSA